MQLERMKLCNTNEESEESHLGNHVPEWFAAMDNGMKHSCGPWESRAYVASSKDGQSADFQLVWLALSR